MEVGVHELSSVGQVSSKEGIGSAQELGGVLKWPITISPADSRARKLQVWEAIKGRVQHKVRRTTFDYTCIASTIHTHPPYHTTFTHTGHDTLVSPQESLRAYIGLSGSYSLSHLCSLLAVLHSLLSALLSALRSLLSDVASICVLKPDQLCRFA
jgi:hypothetical protein